VGLSGLFHEGLPKGMWQAGLKYLQLHIRVAFVTRYKDPHVNKTWVATGRATCKAARTGHHY